MKRLFDPAASPMKVALFMSGSGTNAVKILEHMQALRRDSKSPYEVSVIFTDRMDSNAYKIAGQFDLPGELHDIRRFYENEGRERSDLSVRPKYFERVLRSLQAYKVDLVVLAGYMVILTEPFFSQFSDRAVNVHPADLSIRDANGRALLTGEKAVADAILSEHGEIRSTTHIVTADVDQGSPLIVSRPMRIELPEGVSVDQLRHEENKGLLREVSDAHQDRLKETGDWKIYPLTVEWMARGYFARDSAGMMHLNGEAIPSGFKLE